jgi:superfamily II DNA or RNA helicase
MPTTPLPLLTAHQARLHAYELTRRRSGDDRLTAALYTAAVDLNPHQVDAALFALHSPLSQGVVLADEVGLGKTIEAGIVLCQLWAERRRRLLVICPASIRKQWQAELADKFSIPAEVLDRKRIGELRAEGRDPLQGGSGVVILSHAFAARIGPELGLVSWDLVVIDEAHKLRNAWRPGNMVGQAIRRATEGRRKLLLTATPLQNSLVEVYGLSTLIDDHLFGDVDSFRARYMSGGADLGDLRRRIGTFCKRTLRRDVTEYIRYTDRKALTQPFTPSDDEHAFYESVSTFLQREDSYALPSRQRHLTLLVLRKLLASSPPAIAGTLDTLVLRLEGLRARLPTPESEAPSARLTLDDDDEQLLSEILGDVDDDGGGEQDDDAPEEVASASGQVDRARLEGELRTLRELKARALSLGIDTKTRNLLKALEIGFDQMASSGAARKAIVFTESRRTQEHLLAFLERSGYAGQIVLFNGTNQGPDARAILDAWRVRHAGTGRVSGSRDLDVRSALVDHFRDHASILLATEAAAEGVNLQFCSLIVNFDLPWNPQRIEQRIGRCHRYGQKHDVVVINFLNEKNHADRRVLELLTEKFELFDGVFGASDTVLGSVESGLDVERRILAIYQECRSPEAIDAAFGALRTTFASAIAENVAAAHKRLLDHFDEDVHDRLRLQLESTRAGLDRFGRRFWALTRFILDGRARFDDDDAAFELRDPPLTAPASPAGRYELQSRFRLREDFATGGAPADEALTTLYRLSHPLADYVVTTGKALATPPVHLVFELARLPARAHVVEALAGQRGYLTVTWLAIDAAEREEHLLYSGISLDGTTGRSLPSETLERLMAAPARAAGAATVPADVSARLDAEAMRAREAAVSASAERTRGAYQAQREKLDRWADDKVLALERALAATRDQIRALRRESRLATTVDAQVENQRRARELEDQQRAQRRAIFEAEDAIAGERDRLIAALERRIAQTVHHETLMTIEWSVR